MDTCQHNLLEAVCREPFNLCYYIFKPTASDTSSGIRNDTIAAKLITAVLHLDEGSRVLLCLVYKELLKIMLSIIISSTVSFTLSKEYSSSSLTRSCFLSFPMTMSTDKSFNTSFHLSAHSSRLPQLLSPDYFLCLVKHLSGFSVSHVGD